MKSILRTLLIVAAAAVVLSFAVIADAQRGMGRSGMVPGVDLTQQQQQQVAEIRQQGQMRIRDVQSDPNLTSQQKQQRVQEIQQQTHAAVMSVLTPEQRQQFTNWWQQRQGSMAAGQGRGPGMQGRGPMHGQMMTGGVVPGLQQNPLTQDQRDQIAQIRRNAEQQMQNVTNNPNLTQDQKWDQISQIQRKAHDDIVNLMTPEQQQEFTNWWRQRQGSGAGMQ